MEPTQSTPSPSTKTAPVVPQAERNVRGENAISVDDQMAATNLAANVLVTAPGRKLPQGMSSGYGLPCAHCHIYFPANVEACPCCGRKERVSPNITHVARATPAKTQSELDVATLEKEREAFLQQLNSQIPTVLAESSMSADACILGHNHPQSLQPPSICRSCYDRLQQHVDILEASLHIDLREAAQIVYDAVWADPSDPAKTYANSAAALLAELRERGGVSASLGPFQQRGN
jgi:hypothetical protein